MTTSEYLRAEVYINQGDEATVIYDIIKPYLAYTDNSRQQGYNIWHCLVLPGEIALFLYFKHPKYITLGADIPSDFEDCYNGIYDLDKY